MPTQTDFAKALRVLHDGEDKRNFGENDGDAFLFVTGQEPTLCRPAVVSRYCLIFEAVRSANC